MPLEFLLDKYPVGVYIINTLPGYMKGENTMEKTCCGEKKTLRSEEQRKKLIHRLNRLEGQIRGIRGMVERDCYCTDILTQSAAVQAALNAFNRELIAAHLHSCVARDLREGKDEVIDELVLTLQKLMK